MPEKNFSFNNSENDSRFEALETNFLGAGASEDVQEKVPDAEKRRITGPIVTVEDNNWLARVRWFVHAFKLTHGFVILHAKFVHVQPFRCQFRRRIRVQELFPANNYERFRSKKWFSFASSPCFLTSRASAPSLVLLRSTTSAQP